MPAAHNAASVQSGNCVASSRTHNGIVHRAPLAASAMPMCPPYMLAPRSPVEDEGGDCDEEHRCDESPHSVARGKWHHGELVPRLTMGFSVRRGGVDATRFGDYRVLQILSGTLTGIKDALDSVNRIIDSKVAVVGFCHQPSIFQGHDFTFVARGSPR